MFHVAFFKRYTVTYVLSRLGQTSCFNILCKMPNPHEARLVLGKRSANNDLPTHSNYKRSRTESNGHQCGNLGSWQYTQACGFSLALAIHSDVVIGHEKFHPQKAVVSGVTWRLFSKASPGARAIKLPTRTANAKIWRAKLAHQPATSCPGRHIRPLWYRL